VLVVVLLSVTGREAGVKIVCEGSRWVLGCHKGQVQLISPRIERLCTVTLDERNVSKGVRFRLVLGSDGGRSMSLKRLVCGLC
jgi:hypothetical protein